MDTRPFWEVAVSETADDLTSLVCHKGVLKVVTSAMSRRGDVYRPPIGRPPESKSMTQLPNDGEPGFVTTYV